MLSLKKLIVALAQELQTTESEFLLEEYAEVYDILYTGNKRFIDQVTNKYKINF